MAASDEAELVRMINTSTEINDRPCAFRYPRGTGLGSILPSLNEKIEIGKSKIIKEGKKLAILNFGTRLEECKKASEILFKKGIEITIIDAREEYIANVKKFVESDDCPTHYDYLLEHIYGEDNVEYLP